MTVTTRTQTIVCTVDVAVVVVVFHASPQLNRQPASIDLCNFTRVVCQRLFYFSIVGCHWQLGAATLHLIHTAYFGTHHAFCFTGNSKQQRAVPACFLLGFSGRGGRLVRRRR